MPCTCIDGGALPELNSDLIEYLGETHRLILQKTKNGTALNVMSLADAPLLASWNTLFTASNDSKAVVSPLVEPQDTEGGDARTSPTVGGGEKALGTKATKFVYHLSDYSQQEAIVPLKSISCALLSVYLVTECGHIVGIKDGDNFRGFPIMRRTYWVSDKKPGGESKSDMNILWYTLPPGWSDKLQIVKPSDFNPLDL